MSTNVEESAALAHRLLGARRATVATAESLTGGRLAAAFTAVPGASSTYLGGVVAYAGSLKVELVGVPETVVDVHGVVSAECARAMANGVRGLTGADYGVSTTGVAGPDGQEGHPVGTVFVAVSGPAGDRADVLALSGSRAEVQDGACRAALSLLVAVLHEEETGVG